MNTNPKLGHRGEWYVAIQILLFVLILFTPLFRQKLIEWPRPWDMIGLGLGVVLGLIGTLTVLAGIRSLGRNLTAVPYPKENAVLVESGAYRFVRHPIYSGIILGSFGWALLNNDLLTLMLAFMIFVFFDIKSRREEQWLSEKFAGYIAYQARVRKLIPLIY